MECRMCGGLVEWRSVACDQTQCRRCGATDSQVREEEQDDNAGPTGEEAVAQAWGWLEASAGQQWASADEATNDGGPTESDLLGEVQHVSDHDKWVEELASEIEWEPLRTFVLRLKPEADLRGEVE